MILLIEYMIIFTNNLYCKMSGYYNEDGALDENVISKNFYCLDQVIKQNTNDKEFIPWIEKLETNLPTTYRHTLLVIIILFLLSY